MKQSETLLETYQEIVAALNSADAEAVNQYFDQSPDILLIGTDPEEWWVGYDKVTEIWKIQLAEMGGFQFQSGATTQAFEEGSVGWVADRPSVVLPDGTALPLRVSATFHQSVGDWKVVQWHASLGVGNEESLGRELTT